MGNPSMTISDLIAKLREMPEDALVLISDVEYGLGPLSHIDETEVVIDGGSYKERRWFHTRTPDPSDIKAVILR